MDSADSLSAPFVELQGYRLLNPAVVRLCEEFSHPFRESRRGSDGVRGRQLAGDRLPLFERKDDPGHSASPRPQDATADARASVDYSASGWLVAATATDRRAAGA